ncbi:hypothetical protein [Nevskia ramosa]|uniref:hypothetical protein n=1 Tax=Nevskia ramosa TaxID=64002 RepID=UPI002354862A|nr:hypothetical protein [Nevskia ramosa]
MAVRTLPVRVESDRETGTGFRLYDDSGALVKIDGIRVIATHEGDHTSFEDRNQAAAIRDRLNAGGLTALDPGRLTGATAADAEPRR